LNTTGVMGDHKFFLMKLKYPLAKSQISGYKEELLRIFLKF